MVTNLLRFLDDHFPFKKVNPVIGHLGVDNGATGAAAAAPIIWLVVVLQK